MGTDFEVKQGETSEAGVQWYIERTFEDESGNVKQHVVVIFKLRLAIHLTVHVYVHDSNRSQPDCSDRYRYR